MKKIVVIILMLFAVSLNAQSFSLAIQMNDGSEIEWTSESLKNIYFEGDTTLVVVESENMLTHSYSISNVSKIYFNSHDAVAELGEENSQFVYPNQANDFIRILGIENQTIEILSLDGKTLFKGYYDGESIDIADFPQGTYIIRTNCQTLKFNKI